MKLNKQYFLVRIDKAAQTERRNFITSKSAGYLGIRDNANRVYSKGVLVGVVDSESPAQLANFQYGDLLLAIDERELNSFEDLLDAVTSHSPGDEVTITYISKFILEAEGISGKQSTKKVKLGHKTAKLHLSHVKEFEYNLQYGTVIEMGSEAHKLFPDAEVGDTLIFHHAVEYKERTTGDKLYNDWHFLQNAEGSEDELRLVRYDNELFGVIKTDSETGQARIIPHENIVFCHQNFEKASFQKRNGVWQPDGWEMQTKQYEERLEELKAQIQEISTTSILKEKTSDQNYKKKEEIIAAINKINKEREHLSREMNKPRLVEATVLFVNPKTNIALKEELKTGDIILSDFYTLYPLEFGGAYFVLAKVKTIQAIILKSHIMQEDKVKLIDAERTGLSIEELMERVKNCNPLRDKVLVIPDVMEKRTESGLIIPETAITKPVTGTVAAVGKGLPGIEPEVKVGDKVKYGRYAGIDIEINGGDYRLMREDDINVILP